MLNRLSETQAGLHRYAAPCGGRAMHAAAKAFCLGRSVDRHAPPPTKDEALAILDEAAADFIGADAEFDDYLMLPSPLALLVAIAFDATPEEVADGNPLTAVDGDDFGEVWYAGPITRFSERYKFC